MRQLASFRVRLAWGRLRVGCGLAGAALVLLVAAPAADAAVTPAFPVPTRASSEQVAVLRDGVVWFDQGRVLFQGFWSGPTTIGGAGGSSTEIASSANAVVLTAETPGLFAGGFPPERLAPVEGSDEESREYAGGECPGWTPRLGSSAEDPGDFAVAAGELIDTGECRGQNGGFDDGELAAAQPLFVHKLRGGDWHVLHWLTGHEAPILATEGHLLAIGEPLPTERLRVTVGEPSPAERMRVTILDLAGGRVVPHFEAPLGALSFASSRQVVLSVRERVASSSSATTPEDPVRLESSSYRLELYGLHGGPIAYLGSFPAVPLVSNMHLLVEEYVEGQTVLTVRSVLDGSSRRLIGFNSPARALEAVGFRWPAVAMVETTSAPLVQSEVTCSSGQYHHSSPPALRIFDLARSERFLPSPPSAHLAPPVGPCPPPVISTAEGTPARPRG